MVGGLKRAGCMGISVQHRYPFEYRTAPQGILEVLKVCSFLWRNYLFIFIKFKPLSSPQYGRRASLTYSLFCGQS